jgi:hypothetical protein
MGLEISVGITSVKKIVYSIVTCLMSIYFTMPLEYLLVRRYFDTLIWI